MFQSKSVRLCREHPLFGKARFIVRGRDSACVRWNPVSEVFGIRKSLQVRGQAVVSGFSVRGSGLRIVLKAQDKATHHFLQVGCRTCFKFKAFRGFGC